MFDQASGPNNRRKGYKRYLLALILGTGLLLPLVVSVHPSFRNQQSVLEVTPHDLSFVVEEAGVDPPAKALTLANNGETTLNWEASANVSWIVLGASEGTLSGGRRIQLHVFVEPEGLEPNTHNGTITIDATDGQGDSVQVDVSLMLVPAGPLEVEPSHLRFQSHVGSAIHEPQTLTLANAGEVVLHWRATTEAPWLVLGAQEGTLRAGQSVDMAVFVRTSGLPAGDHEGMIRFTVPSSSRIEATRIAVTLHLDRQPAQLSVQPTQLTFRAQADEPPPEKQVLTVANEGGQALAWSAHSDANWLQISRHQGTLSGGEEQRVNVSVASADLSVGSHSTTLIISTPEAGQSRVPVKLEVRPQPARLEVTPSKLSFTATKDEETPTPKTLTLTNAGGQTLNWQAQSAAGWLNLARTQGELTAGAKQSLEVSVQPEALEPDTHRTDIVIEAPEATNSPAHVAVVMQLEGSTALATLQGHSFHIFSVAFSPDVKRLASGSGDGTIRIWEVPSGRETHTLDVHTDSVNAVAFSPTGERLASGSGDGSIRVWRVPKWKSQMEFQQSALTGRGVFAVAFQPEGQLIASAAADGSIAFWNPYTGIQVHKYQAHDAKIQSLSFSPDGQRLVSASDDSTLKIWKVPSGEVIQTLSGHSGRVWSVDFGPDGQWIASAASDETIKLWSTDTGDELRTLRDHTGPVYAVAIGPQGDRLASASQDGTVKLWDRTSGDLMHTFAGHQHAVWTVEFSPDGEILASGSSDQTIKLWEVPR